MARSLLENSRGSGSFATLVKPGLAREFKVRTVARVLSRLIEQRLLRSLTKTSSLTRSRSIITLLRYTVSFSSAIRSSRRYN